MAPCLLYGAAIRRTAPLDLNLCSSLMLAGLGVKLASLWGMLSFVLNYIPNVGSIIAILLPLPIGPCSTTTILQTVFGSPSQTRMGHCAC